MEMKKRRACRASGFPEMGYTQGSERDKDGGLASGAEESSSSDLGGLEI